MSYSSEQSIPSQHNDVDSNLSRKILFNLNRRDQCDLVALEYIAQQADPFDRGLTVVEMMSVMDLSNPATSSRLRRMSDIDYGRIDIPLLERRKLAGPQGADWYFLAKGVTLADIQKIMAKKGYSYDNYHAKRREKKQGNIYGDYESAAGDDLEDQSIDFDSAQIDTQFSENPENQEESNSLGTNATDTLNAKEIDDSDCDNENVENATDTQQIDDSDCDNENVENATDTQQIDDSDCENENVEGLEVIIVRLVKEVAELKQNYTLIKEENVLLKQEIAYLKSQLAKLEQKLSTGSYNRLVAKLDQVFAPSQIQNGKDAH